jgi:hypothetical protein
LPLRYGSTSSAALSRKRWAETVGAQAELVGELGGGAWHGQEALEDGRPSGSQGSLYRSPIRRGDEELHSFATPRGPYARVGR